jgi:hypothetical protein
LIGGFQVELAVGLQQVAARAGGQARAHGLLVVVHREQQHPGAGTVALEPRGQHDPADDRQGHVQDRDVGLLADRQGERGLAVRGLAADQPSGMAPIMSRTPRRTISWSSAMRTRSIRLTSW